MNAAISISTILEKLTDLLPLTYDQLEGMTAKQLRDDVAKILGIPKAYQLKKVQLLKDCWQVLENVRAQLQADESEREQGKITLKDIKKNDAYQIPVSEVAGKAYTGLREIAKKESNLQEMKEAINGVVAAIACSEMREYNFSVVRVRRVDINKALKSMANAEIPLLKETMQVLVDYFYSQLLSFQREDSIEFNKVYKGGRKAKNRDKTPIKITKLVNDCRQTLQDLKDGKKPHWTKVAIALVLGSGRRPSEIHALAVFEVIGENKILFSGQAKTRDAEDAKDNYEIPTLFPATLLKQALDYLDENGRRLPAEAQRHDRNAVNKTFGMAHSRAIEKYKSDIPGITMHKLRAIYAESLWGLMPKSEQEKAEKHTYYSDWLGHIDKDGKDDATFKSYMLYSITDLDCLR